MPFTPDQLFSYMAGPRLAGMEFTPTQTEEQVQDYLRRLTQAVREPGYDPNGAINALVFGEWGHGKSQVLYRASLELAGLDHVIPIRLIPERLSADMILLGAARALREQGHEQAADLLQSSAQIASDFGVDSIDAVMEAAESLSRVAQQLGAKHFVLLLDEAALMGIFDLQEFLRETSLAFRSVRIQLHTLQCHSLVTLDKARAIANNLGEWLESAVQIHLPSIRLDDSKEFFASRIRKVTGDNLLADVLIPEGIAKAICEAAGGNPRLMHQYAGAVYRLALADGREQCSGDDVVAAFRAIPVGRSGTLFSDQEFKRITELLPQEWGQARYGHFAEYLVHNIGLLFGAWAEVKAPTMALACGMTVPELQVASTKTVSGLTVIETSTDEIFGDLHLKISREFRSRLSCNQFSSGTVEHKKHQVELIVGPQRLQEKLTRGLSKILRARGFVLDTAYQPLGTTQINGGAPITFAGQVLQVPLEESRYWVRVLTVALFGHTPSPELLQIAHGGIRDKNWDFILFCHRSLEAPWVDWWGSPEAANFRELLGHKATCVIHMDPAEDLPFEEDGSDTNIFQRGVTFYANLVAATLPGEFSSEIDAAGTICQRSFQAIRPTRRHVCYLPNHQERTLLQHASWQTEGGQSFGDIQKSFPGDFERVADLRELGDEYLEKLHGRRLGRRSPDTWKIWTRIRQALEGQPTVTVEAISIHLSESECLVGHTDELQANVEWVLGMMRSLGQAESRGNEWRFLDLTKAKNDLILVCKNLISECGILRSHVEAFDNGISARHEIEFYDELKVLPTADCKIPELAERRDCLIRCKSDLESVDKRNRNAIQAIIEYFDSGLTGIRLLIQNIAQPIAGFLGLIDQLVELEQERSEFRRDADDPTTRGIENLMRSRRLVFDQKLAHLKHSAEGTGVNQTDPMPDRLIAGLLSTPNYIRVLVTEEREA